MKDFLKKYWKIITGVVGAIVGLILLKQHFTKDLLAQLLNMNTKAKDDVLNERKSEVQRKLEDEKANNDALRKELNKPAPNASNQEIEDFYKSRK